MMETVKMVFKFFDFPKRNQLLQELIQELLPKNELREKLIDCCRTRWVQKNASFDVFHNMYRPVQQALINISRNEPWLGHQWNNDSVRDANNLVVAIMKGAFLVTLHVVRNLIGYLQSLTIRLQERKADIAKALVFVTTVREELSKVRREIDVNHEKYFNDATTMAEKYRVKISKPRVCDILKYRDNHPAETVSEYFKRTLTIPFLDSLVTQMNERFTPKHLAVYCGFNILPAVMKKDPANWRTGFQKFLDVYRPTISS